MRSPLLFLSLALLAQYTVSLSVASPAEPGNDAVHAGSVGAMLVLAGPPKSGYKYSAPGGAFTATFPGKPEAMTQTGQAKGISAKVLMVIYSADGGKRLYAISSTPIKLGPGDGTVADAIAGTIDGMTQSGNVTKSQETKINYKGAPGKQFYLTIPQGKEKVRVIAVKTKQGVTVYALNVLDKGGQVDDAKATAFLDSLAFKSR